MKSGVMEFWGKDGATLRDPLGLPCLTPIRCDRARRAVIAYVHTVFTSPWCKDTRYAVYPAPEHGHLTTLMRSFSVALLVGP
jgi:hypothetical protein